jgi:hypothetical protein
MGVHVRVGGHECRHNEYPIMGGHHMRSVLLGGGSIPAGINTTPWYCLLLATCPV